MVRSSPALSKKISIFKNNLSIANTASKFEPLGKDSDSCDGLNIHGAILDELHAHKTADMWNVLETATGSRRQPLQIAITTAGYDRHSICWEMHEYTTKILKGFKEDTPSVEDDTLFGIIYTLDEGDNWKEEDVWAKANPNLGVSVKLDDLQRKCNKAALIPSAQNEFLRKHLDVWTQQSDRWIDLDLWDANFAYEVKEGQLYGRTCCGGLDLSSVSDMTAWVMVFSNEDEPDRVDILPRFWVPEAKLYDKRNRYRDQYQAWHNAGYLKVTPGDAIDYQEVKAQIVRDAGVFNLKSMSVDRLFQGYQLSMELNQELGGSEKNPKVIAMGMGWKSMTPPMREIEARLLRKQINHGRNPVLRWMADNVAIKEDPAGNKSPNKADSQGKIDGIVALLLALDRCMRHQQSPSLYETEKVKVL